MGSRVRLSWNRFLVVVATALVAAPVLGAAPSPVVGMGGYVNLPSEGDVWGSFPASRPYWSSLRSSGALVVHLLPAPDPDVDEILDRVDGLLLPGGPDVDPARYGESRHPTVKVLEAEREAFDLALARRAVERDMPVLGICLGSQELNVVLGGSLIQDVPSQVGDAVRHRPLGDEELLRGMHEVSLVRGGRLQRIYGASAIGVNSYHHQAVGRLGRGVVVTARAGDGVVEGFEVPGRRFVLGVQFHPERQDESVGLHRPLFDAFVAACRRYRGLRGR